MNNILSGLDDVPSVADDRCCRCGALLTDDNFKDWFVFDKVGSQMYKMPICEDCNKKTSAEGAKIE